MHTAPRALCALLLLLAATACEGSDPNPEAVSPTEKPGAPDQPAPPPAPSDPAWEEVQRIVSSADETSHTKKRRLERYIQNHPGSPHLPEARKRLAEVNAEVERDLAEQKRRAETAKERLAEQARRQQEEAEQRYAKLLAEGVPALAVRGLAKAGDWSPDKRVAADQFTPVVLTVDQKEHRFQHPGRGSIGTFYGGASDIVYSDLPHLYQALKAEFPKYPVRRRALVNRLLRQHIGGDLLPVDSPGTVDKARLKALIDAMRLAPTDTVLGHKAADVYRLAQPMLADHALNYVALRDRVGRTKALAAYKAALAAEETTWEGDMGRFYERFTKENKLPPSDWYGADVITGFWMRRMADGTDAMIYKALRDTAQRFDPALYKQLKP